MAAPTVDRPDMPEDYGPRDTLDGVLPWSWADERLAGSRNYWVATTTADGAPHVAPVWGTWVAGALWFGTSPASAKGRHLHRDPRVVVNLESGDEVVIVHGDAALVPVSDLDDDLRRRLDDGYGAKYVDPETGEPMRLAAGPPGTSIVRVAPRKVLGWSEHDFVATRTRWRFTD